MGQAYGRGLLGRGLRNDEFADGEPAASNKECRIPMEGIGTGVEQGMLTAGCGIWRVDLLWGGWDNGGDGYY